MEADVKSDIAWAVVKLAIAIALGVLLWRTWQDAGL
jgi:hypothetical protein